MLLQYTHAQSPSQYPLAYSPVSAGISAAYPGLHLLGHQHLAWPFVAWFGTGHNWPGAAALTIGSCCTDGLMSVDDPQFQSSFTDVYSADSLQV